MTKKTKTYNFALFLSICASQIFGPSAALGTNLQRLLEVHPSKALTLAEIDQQTLDILQSGYTTEAGKKISINDFDTALMIKKTRKMSSKTLATLKKGQAQTLVSLVNKDSFAAARHLSNKGYKNIGVLNFANKQHPGGGFPHGAMAQEEDLCRTSTLYLALVAMDKKGQYPIAHDELIISEGVKIIRGPRHTGYAFLDELVSVTVVSQAAYNLNPSHRTYDNSFVGHSNRHKRQKGMEMKIRNQLRAFSVAGCEGIVLGAFRCGEFRNEPAEVASYYKKVLNEPEFKNAFKEIVFAILGEKTSANYIAFSDTL